MSLLILNLSTNKETVTVCLMVSGCLPCFLWRLGWREAKAYGGLGSGVKAGSLAPELTLLIAIYLMLFLKNSAKWRLRQMTSNVLVLL